MDATLEPPPLPVSASGRVPRWHRLGAVVAVAAMVADVVLIQLSAVRPVTIPTKADVTPNAGINMLARYGHGTKLLMTRAQQWDHEGLTAVERALEPLARKPVDKFRAEIVLGLMKDEMPDFSHFETLEAEAPWLRRDLEVLAEVQQHAAAPADWEWFLARHGWIARVARAQTIPKSAPEWRALDADATRTVIALVVAVMAMGASLLAGMALLAVAVLRWKQGRVSAGIERLPKPWGGVLLEGFAIYLCGWTLLPQTVRHFFPTVPLWVPFSIAALTVPVAMLWPRWRGMDRSTWAQSLGLHLGKGFWREAAAGALGWIATTPFIALALCLAQWIVQRTNVEVTHPITEPLTTPGVSQIAAVLLAVVWAPLAEETMFRGLLFPGLSAVLRWVMGAVVGAFIFAVLHPQGWVAVPAIMAIALGASALRLVRGSLIASMTLHAINNGILVLLLILCAG